MTFITTKEKRIGMITFCDACNKIINGRFGGGETLTIDSDTHEIRLDMLHSKNYHEKCHKEVSK